MMNAAWQYRHFVVSSIRNEYRARFARSKLGGLWMVIHPLINAAIFALVLAEVMAAKLPGMAANRFAYPIYLMSGILAWSLFAEVATRCLTLFIDNGNLLKKLVFPRICLPLIAAGTVLVNGALLFVAIIVLFALLGHIPSLQILWVPVLMVFPLALGLGLGLLVGVFNVFVRDVGQVVPVVLQLGFWFTPIVYTIDVLPASLAAFIVYNPMTPIVASFQNVMLFGTAPVWDQLAWIGLLGASLLGISLLLFRRGSGDMVDAL